MQETQVQSLGQEDPLEDEMATYSSIGLKLNIQKTKIMAPSSITSWQIDWETMVTLTDSILGGSKVTTDGDCSHKFKKCLLLGKKSYDEPRCHIKKQRQLFVD